MVFIFSADETLDVGGDLTLPVTDDYSEGDSNEFSGKINWVRIDLEEDNVSHLGHSCYGMISSEKKRLGLRQTQSQHRIRSHIVRKYDQAIDCLNQQLIYWLLN